jgi:cyclophilin family peptidyl-prolyl cis-trans isomerase
MGTNKRVRKKENRQQRIDRESKSRQRRKTRKNIVRLVVVGGIIVGVTVIIAVSGGTDPSSTDTADSLVSETTAVATATDTGGRTITGETPCPAVDGTEERAISFEQAPPTCITEGAVYTAIVTTNKGELAIELDAKRAPIAVNSFVTLARYKYFDGTLCHRAIPGFVVQCGDPTASGSGGPGYSFIDELPKAGEYVIGAIAMANSGPNTNGSQFFIITGNDGAQLPPNYTLFGQVSEGLDKTVPALDAAANPDPAANGVPPLEMLQIISVVIAEN